MAFPEMVELRKKMKMPQFDMAVFLGVKNTRHISQWETGYRQPTEVVRRLVRYLNSLSYREAKLVLSEMRRRASINTGSR